MQSDSSAKFPARPDPPTLYPSSGGTNAYKRYICQLKALGIKQASKMAAQLHSPSYNSQPTSFQKVSPQAYSKCHQGLIFFSLSRPSIVATPHEHHQKQCLLAPIMSSHMIHTTQPVELLEAESGSSHVHSKLCLSRDPGHRPQLNLMRT